MKIHYFGEKMKVLPIQVNLNSHKQHINHAEDKNFVTEETITLPITGMTCVNCAANIERGLKKQASKMTELSKNRLKPA